MESEQPTDELLNTPDAAALLGVASETVRRWARDQRIRHVVLPSGHMRFRRSDVEALLAPIEPKAKATS